MSNIDVRKQRAVEKRVSFDGNCSDIFDQQNYNTKFKHFKKRTFSEDDPSVRKDRIGSYNSENSRVESDSKLSETDSNISGYTNRSRKPKILRNAKSNQELFSEQIDTNQRYRSHWNIAAKKLVPNISPQRKRHSSESQQHKIQFVGIEKKIFNKDTVMEVRKLKLAKQKQDAKLARLHLFRMAGKMTVYCIRLMNMHSLRNRENDDEVSPFIKGLHFRDYDSPIELMFDPSKFKANKSLRLSDETKRILSKESHERTEHEVYSAQIALRNIKSISDYPARMQRKIAEIGVYERYEAKRIIVRQGHPPSGFYFILSGEVVVMKMDESNTYARPVLHLTKGDSFGELGIIQGTRRKATIICREPTELLSVSKKDYHDIFMLGGVKTIGDPDQDQFLKHLSFLQKWPLDLLKDNEDKTMFHYYKRGDIVAKDTNYFDWIIVVKSGSVSILKKLKKVSPFEWKNKVKTEFVSEKQKRDIADQKDINRRLAQTELHIPLRLQYDDDILEEYPGKFKVFTHPIDTAEYMNIMYNSSSSPEGENHSTRSSFSLPEIHIGNKSVNKKRSSFQNIQTLYLPSLSEDGSSVDYSKYARNRKDDVGTGKLLLNTDSRRKESIVELEKEMIGFQEEKLTYRDNIDTGINRKDPDNITEADLKPEFVIIQTLTKGQTFGLSELILDPQPSFCIVSNGADCILIDKQFYISNAPEQLKNKLRQELCPYPSEEEMQTRLQHTVDWEAYRSNIMIKTIKTIKPKRPVKAAVQV